MKGDIIEVSVVGRSMWPTLLPGDRLQVSLHAEASLHDIVVYPSEVGWVAHRVVDIEFARVRCRGDARQSSDGWVPKVSIVGVAIAVKRLRRWWPVPTSAAYATSVLPWVRRGERVMSRARHASFRRIIRSSWWRSVRESARKDVVVAELAAHQEHAYASARARWGLETTASVKSRMERRPPAMVCVASRGDEVVGAAEVHRVGDAMELLGVTVSRSFRGLGVAGELLRLAIAECGDETLVIKYRRTNLAMKALLKRHGAVARRSIDDWEIVEIPPMHSS